MRKRIILLLVFAGLSFLVAVTLLMTGPRMRFQPSVNAFEQVMPYPPENATEFFNRQFDTASFVIPAGTNENIEKGHTYYTYYCFFCHGNDGRGNGEVGKSYIPRPADLSGVIRSSFSNGKLYEASFKGTGHSPVLERVVPYEYRPYILLFVRSAF